MNNELVNLYQEFENSRIKMGSALWPQNLKKIY